MANQLIDCTTFHIDRKVVINIGLDPIDLLFCVVHLHTNSKCLHMSINIFQSLLELLTKTIQKHRTIQTEEFFISPSTRSDKVLIIKSLSNNQCAHLNEKNILYLLQNKNDIQKTISIKDNVIRPRVLSEYLFVMDFLVNKMPICKTKTLNEIEDSLKSIDHAAFRADLPIGEHLYFLEHLLFHFSKGISKTWSKYGLVHEIHKPRTRAYIRQQMAKNK